MSKGENGTGKVTFSIPGGTSITYEKKGYVTDEDLEIAKQEFKNTYGEKVLKKSTIKRHWSMKLKPVY